MGTLHCLKCDQTVEGKTFEEADTLIDHAANSRKCSGNPDYMKWNNEKLGFNFDAVATRPTPMTKKSTKKRG